MGDEVLPLNSSEALRYTGAPLRLNGARTSKDAAVTFPSYDRHQVFAPTSLNLRCLFHDSAIFDSRGSWRRAGFSVEGKGAKSDIMVASHPSAQGYLFKKYNVEISPGRQLKNYRCRIEGAQKLREFIGARHLTRITVPEKYLYKLPPESCHDEEFCYVLIVERLTLLDSSQTKQLYRQIDTETLKQLCTVLRVFSGLGSGARNVPFTNGGQIAFVDTERWDETKEAPLRHLSPYLSKEKQELAEKILRK